jgi:SHS2 domain-containing protein
VPKEIMTMSVLGRKITYEIDDIDIDSLEFYPENPRIYYVISKYPPEKVTQDFIEEELYKLDSTKELIKDLEENKGLLDEVYVLGNKVMSYGQIWCMA